MRKPNFALLSTVPAAAVIVTSLTVIGVVAGLLLNLAQGPKWTATTNVLVRVASVDGLLLTGISNPVSIADQIDESVLATSQDVLIQAARELHVRGGLAEMQQDVTAAPQGSSHVIVITATKPDAATAQQTADVVAAIFVRMTQQRLASIAANVAANLPPTTAPAESEILRRAQLITRTLQPLQIFHDQQPTQQSQVRTPVALGIVGLAAGALVVLALTFLGRRVDKPRDAQRLLSVPAVHHDRSRGGAAAVRLVRCLLHRHPHAELLICPVDLDAQQDAVRFAQWTREQGQDTAPHEVRVMPEPTSTVISTQPQPDKTAGLLLVVPRGTSRQVLADAAALLATWRPVDAVVVTT